jgi:hypothetical protein
MAEITLAFGKEIQLTKDKKTGKEIFVKLSVAFRDEQLRELKGAPLSVLICRALHADERGYTFVSNKTISKETGYSEITPANRFLVNKKYLFMEQLVDSSGRFRGWVSRLFLPVEPDFETTLVKSGKKIRVFVKLTELGKSPTSVKPRSRENTDLTRTSIITRTNNSKKERNILKKEKKSYSSLENIAEEDLVEISEAYRVPLALVKLQLEKMSNWCEAKGKRYKNYKRALMNWVLKEAESKIERRSNEKYRAVDARNVK